MSELKLSSYEPEIEAMVSIECDYLTALLSNDAKIGCLLKLSFNGIELDADILLRDPSAPDKRIQAVAVIERMKWTGLPMDSIDIVAKFSPKNKALMQEAFCSTQERMKIGAVWEIFDYDYHAQKHFRSFHTGNIPLKLMMTENRKAYIQETPDGYMKRPGHFTFELFLIADSESPDQELFLAFSSTGKTFSRQISSLTHGSPV